MKELIPDALLEHVARRFRVLGDASRLAIVRFLLTTGEANVGEVVDALAMSQANVSKHLRTLLDAGVLTRRQEGTSAFYSVSDASVEQVCSIVCDRIQAQARRELRSLAR